MILEAERLDIGTQPVVVRDDARDLDRQLAATPAPEQLHEAVVVPRDEDGDAGAPLAVGDAPVHLEARRDLRAERRRDLGRRRIEGFEGVLHPHEEAPAARVRRVLVGLHDVGAMPEQELRHGRDDTGPVVALDEQARGAGGGGICRRVVTHPADDRQRSRLAPSSGGVGYRARGGESMEPMAVESLVAAHWELEGFLTKVRYPIRLPGGWSDMDVVGVDAEGYVRIAECKVMGPPQFVRVIREDSSDWINERLWSSSNLQYLWGDEQPLWMHEKRFVRRLEFWFCANVWFETPVAKRRAEARMREIVLPEVPRGLKNRTRVKVESTFDLLLKVVGQVAAETIRS